MSDKNKLIKTIKKAEKRRELNRMKTSLFRTK